MDGAVRCRVVHVGEEVDQALQAVQLNKPDNKTENTKHIIVALPETITNPHHRDAITQLYSIHTWNT